MITFLDCTFRDGGYYNRWDFSNDLIRQYLHAVQSAGVNVVELGFRTSKNNGFKGPCAFTTDEFICDFVIPSDLTISVMVNGNELVGEVPQAEVLERLFPNAATNSPVDLVRIACHIHEFEKALPAVTWLKSFGYKVGFNLMQVADRNKDDIKALAKLASDYPLDVLYFADSMGSMKPDHAVQIIKWFRTEWKGSMGIHTHDNLGLGLSNTLRALDEGIDWVDSTLTGMGRGPGNTRTEELAIEIAELRGRPTNMVPMMVLLREHFKPMQAKYGWGTNPYYYLAGKYGIHPTFIQEMLSDSRYSEEDVLNVIERLHVEDGKKFSLNVLETARQPYYCEPCGEWSPKEFFSGRKVLFLGAGPSVTRHRGALERFVRKNKPLVIALNTQSVIDEELIDLRVACHQLRLLADAQLYTRLPQPLITPYSMLPADVQISLAGKEIFDYGLNVNHLCFEFGDSHCVVPSSLAVAYALAVVTSGKATDIFLAGFDGYCADDLRNREMQYIFELYQAARGALTITAITPTRYDLNIESVYGL
jgi:4-hydroxy 2-oxovalerate aldolase